MPPVRLSILIPVYNEANSIRAVLERVVTAPAAYLEAKQIAVHLIVVDDGSRDESCKEVQAFCAEHPEVSLDLIKQSPNAGKGAAIRTAIAHADSDFCLIQDADFEYDPLDYPKLLEPLITDDADAVLGSRFMNAMQRRPFGFWQGAANRAISTFASMAAGLELSDVESGYKAFRTSLGKSIPLYSKRFGLDPEIMIQLAKRHARFIEVPITYHGRTQEQGKKIGARDALLAVGSILRTWLFSAAHKDPGAQMLFILSRAKRFNRWMAETISPFAAGDVLELGAGIGNLTLLLASKARTYTATDTDSDHLCELRSRTAYRPNIRVASCDLSESRSVTPFQQSADTVVCLNVLEHISDDVTGFANVRACLKPGGTAIILVPQGPQAFGSLDEVLEHKRRYTVDELRQKMTAAGIEVTQIIGFNHATFPGWYLNSKILRRRTLSRSQVSLFDLLVPLWKAIDDKLPWPATSLIGIGKVKL
jgi:glycosyltransferase involved in cell wall biosynthesis